VIVTARTNLWCSFSQAESYPLVHWHFGTEFLFVERGTCEVEAEGKRYTLSPHSLLVIGRTKKHAVLSFSEDYARYCLIAQREEISRSALCTEILSSLLSNNGNAVCVNMGDDAEAVSRLFSLFDNKINNAEPDYRRCLLEELLILIRRHGEEKKIFSPSDNRIFAVRDEIDREFASHLSVSELAKRYFICEDYLIHEFSRVLGCSPWHYLLMRRLCYAKELLSSVNEPISIIALRCGFGDANGFIRSFRKQFGISPGQYRKNAVSLDRTGKAFYNKENKKRK